MAYKMKGYSYPGKSPLKQHPKKSTESVDRPEPTYEGTDEYRKEKDIPKKEFKKRGIKKPQKKKKLDHIGKPYMRPPYKDTAVGTRPYEKRQGYHGYKDFDSIIPQFQNKTKK